MKTKLKKFKSWYLNGLLVDYFAEALYQICYVGVVISLALLMRIIYPSNNTYTIVLLGHLLSLYIFCWLKGEWESTILELLYQILFFVINVGLIIVLSTECGILKMVLIIVAIAVPTFIYSKIDSYQYLPTRGKIKKRGKFDRRSKLRIYGAIPVISVFILTMILPCNLIYKILIVLAYVFSIPMISQGVNNEELSITDMFENDYISFRGDD